MQIQITGQFQHEVECELDKIASLKDKYKVYKKNFTSHWYLDLNVNTQEFITIIEKSHLEKFLDHSKEVKTKIKI